jgi:hypothetical protein
MGDWGDVLVGWWFSCRLRARGRRWLILVGHHSVLISLLSRRWPRRLVAGGHPEHRGWVGRSLQDPGEAGPRVMGTRTSLRRLYAPPTWGPAHTVDSSAFRRSAPDGRRGRDHAERQRDSHALKPHAERLEPSQRSRFRAGPHSHALRGGRHLTRTPSPCPPLGGGSPGRRRGPAAVSSRRGPGSVR